MSPKTQQSSTLQLCFSVTRKVGLGVTVLGSRGSRGRRSRRSRPRSAGGRHDGAHPPDLGTLCRPGPAQRSVCGRPGTCVTWRAWTTATAHPWVSSLCTRGIQDTPVEAMPTVVLRQAVHHSASRCPSQGKARKVWRGWAARSAGPQPPGASAPTSRLAACGWMRGIIAGVGVGCLPCVARRASSPGQRGESTGRQDAFCARRQA